MEVQGILNICGQVQTEKHLSEHLSLSGEFLST